VGLFLCGFFEPLIYQSLCELRVGWHESLGFNFLSVFAPEISFAAFESECEAEAFREFQWELLGNVAFGFGCHRLAFLQVNMCPRLHLWCSVHLVPVRPESSSMNCSHSPMATSVWRVARCPQIGHL